MTGVESLVIIHELGLRYTQDKLKLNELIVGKG